MKRYFKYILLFFTVIIISSCVTLNKGNYPRTDAYYPYLYHYNAIVNRLNGNIPFAKASLYEALKIEPNNPAILYELGICNLYIGNVDEAIFLVEKSVQLDSINKKYYTNTLLQLYDKKNLNTKALLLLDDLIIQSPNYLPHLLNYSHFLLKDNKIKEAKAFVKSKSDETNLPEFKSLLIDIYLENKQIDSALVVLNQLEALYPDNSDILLKQATIESANGNDSLAIQKYNQILFHNPSEPRAHYGLIMYSIDNNDYERSIELVNNFIENEGIDDVIKLHLLIELYTKQDFLKTKKLEIEKIESILNSNNINNLDYNKTNFMRYIQSSDFLNAKKPIEYILQIEPNNQEYWEYLTQLEYNLGNKERVIETSTSAINLFPTKSYYYIIKSVVLTEEGRVEESIITLESARGKIQEPKELSDILSTLADQYIKVKNEKKAYSYYKQSIKLNPENDHALNNYSYFLSLDKSKLSKALEMINRVVERNPSNSTYLDTKGWVLFKLGKYTEARDVLRTAIVNGGNSSAVILEHYGDALYKTGNKESAYIYWLKAKEAGGNSENLLIKIKTLKYVE
jgi:tetratricopeptide (TPR) repeat protein